MPISPKMAITPEANVMRPAKNKTTTLGHLSELRSRIIKCVIALLLTTIICFVFTEQIFRILTLPVTGTGLKLVYIDMTEMLGTYMMVSLSAGIALAMPYLVYQVLMFIFPGLTPVERRYVMVALPWIVFMFVAGVAFSYFVLMPPAIRFLLTFGSDIAVPQIRIGSYITLVTRVMLATGVIFELPVISTFLARLGIITSSWLASKRKIAIIGAFVLGAIITPTFDPINQSLVSGPLIILFEMSIWLAKLVQKRAPREVPAQISESVI